MWCSVLKRIASLLVAESPVTDASSAYLRFTFGFRISDVISQQNEVISSKVKNDTGKRPSITLYLRRFNVSIASVLNGTSNVYHWILNSAFTNPPSWILF